MYMAQALFPFIINEIHNTLPFDLIGWKALIMALCKSKENL